MLLFVGADPNRVSYPFRYANGTGLLLYFTPIDFSDDVADTALACGQQLRSHRYDMVLSDYRLPGFMAYKTLDLLRQSGQEIPLILVTGTLGEEAAVECIKAGMTDYGLKDRLFRLPTMLERSPREFELCRQQQAANERIRQQAQPEQLLNQINRALNSSLDVDDILQKIVGLAGECFHVDRVELTSFDAEYFKVVCEWRSNEHPPTLQETNTDLIFGGPLKVMIFESGYAAQSAVYPDLFRTT
ncbi:MAG: response regulator [Oculatellaceae cyanobacterium bins.114]|nr:response regulator [Oculatellaceae cyanobacterium bins.114]